MVNRVLLVAGLVALGVATISGPRLPGRGVDSVETWGTSGTWGTYFGESEGDTVASEAEPATPEPGEDDTAASLRSRVAKVGKGDTLMDVLRTIGVSRTDAFDAIEAMREVFNPRTLMPGQWVTAVYAMGDEDKDTGSLVEITLAPDVDRNILVSRTAEGAFTATEKVKQAERHLVRVSGTVDSSLYQAGTAAGLPAALLVEMIRIFSWDIDFQRDLQPGDRFDVVFEKLVYRGDDEGRDRTASREGNILTASLNLSGENRTVWRFKPAEQEADYFDAQGRSVRKALLRTPIDGARLSSGFGRRSHPILGYTRMHRGVDFAAPSGTPIYAAGSGRVAQAGVHRGYGNHVEIRHTSTYSTSYSHLSRFGRGIRAGATVRQGQVIGYVGSTGLATGPHLHYEVKVSGTQVNPLSIKMPSGQPLKGRDLVRFAAARSALMAEIEKVAPQTRQAAIQ